MNDEFYMKKALELALRGRGLTSPNPIVGTVIVKDGKIIGEGYHSKYGDKHAEIVAIEKAENSVEGATLYCNLEPCSHNIPEKKTPPCTQRIIKENIKRVVIANVDLNPHVNGNGIELLKKHGTKVDIGILNEEAATLNEKYFKYIQTGLPFVHLKIAQSLDGRIATANGNSQWITNQNALHIVHELRAEYDAVLVGAKTVDKDNPSLTVRLTEGRNPYRIVLDDKLIISDDAKLITDELQHKTIIFTVLPPNNSRVKELQKQEIQVISVKSDSDGLVRVETVLERLASLNIASVLVEGGGEIFTSFLRKKLFDKISFFIAPIIIGSGIESIKDLKIKSLADALHLKNIRIEIVDHQAIVHGYKEEKTSIPLPAERP